jgi:hypothetical protein
MIKPDGYCEHNQHGGCIVCTKELLTRIKQLESVVAVCQESRNKWRDLAVVNGERLDKLEAAITGSHGPARETEDEHPVHTWYFDAPVYEPEQGGLRAAIDAITPQ